MAETKKVERQTYAVDYIKADYDRATFLDSPHTDNLMTAMLGLGSEFWAMKRRMMVIEKFMAEKKVLDPAVLEAYNPTDAEKKVWDAERDDFIDRVFSVLTRSTSGPVGGALPSERVPPLTK